MGRRILVRIVVALSKTRRAVERSRVGAHRIARRWHLLIVQVYTFDNTLASTKPKFFVQGEADEVCPLEAMWGLIHGSKSPRNS